MPVDKVTKPSGDTGSSSRNSQPLLLKDLGGEGSAQTWERLHDRHGALFVRIARSIVGNQHAAEEVLQASYLKVWDYAVRHRSTEGETPVKTAFFKRVITNTAINHLNRSVSKTSTPKVSPPSKPVDGESGRSDPQSGKQMRRFIQMPDEFYDDLESRHGDDLKDDEHLTRKEKIAILMEEFVKLAESHQRVLALFHLEGLGLQEIADRLNRTIDGVKSALNKARNALKERMSRRDGARELSVIAILTAMQNDGLAAEPMSEAMLQPVLEAARTGNVPRHHLPESVLSLLDAPLVMTSASSWSMMTLVGIAASVFVSVGVVGAMAWSFAFGPGTSTQDANNATPTSVRPARRRIVLTPEEEAAIEISIRFILDSITHDGKGGMNQAPTTNAAASSVWISPQLVHYQALALLEWFDRKKNPVHWEAARKWLEFCADNSPDGVLPVFEGTRDSYARTGKNESPSNGAMALVLLDRYAELGGTVTPNMDAMARRILSCIRAETDPLDGLVWVSAARTEKQFDQELETFAGLESARWYFTKSGDNVEAALISTQLASMRSSLTKFFDKQAGLFVAKLDNTGNASPAVLNELREDGFAQLVGISFVESDPHAWSAVQSAFPGPDDNFPATSAGSERWLMAASRIGGPDVAQWRAKVVDVMKNSKPGAMYAYRHGLCALGLMSGADFMPSLAGESRPTPE